MKLDKIVEKFGYKRQLVFSDIVDNPLRDIKEGNLRWGKSCKSSRMERLPSRHIRIYGS